MSCEWDPRKDESNFKKHGVRFAEAEPVFEDDFAITIKDDGSDTHEALCLDWNGRVLVAVYCYRGSQIRIISARPAEARERAQYEEHR